MKKSIPLIHLVKNEHAARKKKQFVQDNFDKIAHHYDLFNDLVSFGLHRFWKKKTIILSGLKLKPLDQDTVYRVMDLCCGTGDISLLLEKMLPAGAQIDAIDFSHAMLKIMKKRCQNRSASRNTTKIAHKTEKKRPTKRTNITVRHIAFENIPTQPNYYDAIFIAFGLRNLTNIPQNIKKMYRFLKKNGVLVILDFNRKLPSSFVNYLFQFYLHSIVPRIGFLLHRRRHIMYEYLPQSVKHFFIPQELIALLKKTGFQKVQYQPNLFGQTGIYIAQKL